MSERAYSYIDRGNAIAGNEFIQRAWANFTGQTFSLYDKRGKFDWVTGRTSDFVIRTPDGDITFMDIGDVDCSELANPFGAGITLRRRGPKVSLTTETIVLHELPAYAVRHRLLNRTEEELVVDGFARECLVMELAKREVYTDYLETAQESARATCDDKAVGVWTGQNGIFAGQHGGGTYDLFHSDPAMIRIETKEGFRLAPGEDMAFPYLYVAFFTGAIQDASRKMLGDVLMAVKKMEDEQAAPRDE